MINLLTKEVGNIIFTVKYDERHRLSNTIYQYSLAAGQNIDITKEIGRIVDQFYLDFPISKHAEKHFQRPVIEDDDWVAPRDISYWKWDKLEGIKILKKFLNTKRKLIQSFIKDPDSNILDICIKSKSFVGYTCKKGSDVFKKVNYLKVIIQQNESGYIIIKTVYPVEQP